MLSVTVGTSRATYEHDGRSGDIDLMLWPVNFTLAYVGYEVLAPYVAYGVEAGLRYSDPAAIEERLRAVVADFRARRCRASPSVRPSRSTAWRSGVRTAASLKAPRSTRRLSAARSGWIWSDRRSELGASRLLQRIASSTRSSPQKTSPSTTKVGEPNTPSDFGLFGRGLVALADPPLFAASTTRAGFAPISLKASRAPAPNPVRGRNGTNADRRREHSPRTSPRRRRRSRPRLARSNSLSG